MVKDAAEKLETEQFVCRFPADVLAGVKQYAADHDLTAAQVLRRATREFLARNDGLAQAEPEGT